MTRRLLALAAACVLAWWGVAVALGWATLLDALAVAGLVAWTGVAMFGGAAISHHTWSERFDGALDAALELHREGEQIRLAEALARQRAEIEAKYAADTEAVNDAVKEGR